MYKQKHTRMTRMAWVSLWVPPVMSEEERAEAERFQMDRLHHRAIGGGAVG